MLALVRYPKTRGLLVLPERAVDLPATAAALRAAGLPARMKREGRWAGGRVRYALLVISDAALGGPAEAVRLVASTSLSALARRDAPEACSVLEPDLRVRLALGAGGTCGAAIAPADLHLTDVTMDAILGTARAGVTERPRPLELRCVSGSFRPG